MEHDGKVWAFTLIEGYTKNTELHLFYSETYDGPWTAHPLNPVKSNIRSARPAGTPFVHEGKLYRPSQDCASHYGSAITVNEVLVMTETEFREAEAFRVEPLADSAYPYGLHTLSQVGDATLIDGARKTRAYF